MVVYYATTHYQVLCTIIHKILYKKGEKSILLISDSRVDHDILCEKIEKERIFDKVILYKDREIVQQASREYYLNKTTLNMYRVLNKVCKKVETITPFKIDKTNEYYLLSDFRPFSLYLIKNKIKYNYFEDACGVLSRPELLMAVLKSPWTNKVIKKFHLNGENELVINKYADASAQTEEFYDEKMIDFSIKKLITKLSDIERKKIINIFNAIEIKKSESKNALILTQPFIQRNKISFEAQKNIYGLILDYFFEGMDIYIKPHPVDFLSNYNDWFDKVVLLDGKMPSEMLNVCLNSKFDYGLSISSTAIYSLDNHLKNIIIFDKDAENQIKHLHKYVLTSKIIENLNSKKIDIYLKNINKSLLNEIIKIKSNINIEKIEQLEEIDNILLKKDTKTQNLSVCVLKNVKNYDIFELMEKTDLLIIFKYKSLYIDNFDFINNFNDTSRIFKIKIESSENKVREEEILVCSKNKEIIDKVSKVNYQKDLIHSQLKIKINNYQFLSEEMKDKVIEILSLQNEELRRKLK